jgi:glycine cleavage system regulatory protein
MPTPIVMTFIGRDRPGLVNAISQRIADNGGAWLESRLARLSGQFAGIVLVDIPEAGVAGLTSSLRELDTAGLRVTVERGVEALETEPRKALQLELLGADRPGIVRDVTAALSELGVNIEEFESGLVSAAFTGQPMFKASARLHAPDSLALDKLSKTLERLAGEMMVDISVSEGAR